MRKIQTIKIASILTTLLYIILGILVFSVNPIRQTIHPLRINIALTQLEETVDFTNNAKQALPKTVDEKSLQKQEMQHFSNKTTKAIESSLDPSQVQVYKESKETSKDNEQKNIFLQELDSKIRASLVYPKRAQQRNIEGLVTLLISIDISGKLLKAEVSKTSGSTILDSAALQLLTEIFPLSTHLENDFKTEISISYELQ